MNFSAMSDKAVLEEIGFKIRHMRLSMNISQLDLSQKAGVARIVIQRLENGKVCTTKGLVRIMRALGLIDKLELCFPDEDPSPIELSIRKGRKRERASAKRLN